MLQRALPAIALVGATSLLIGLAFAGSDARLAPGVRIGGVEVGGLTAGAARRRLERRAAALERVPVEFDAGRLSWRLRPAQLGVKVDWSAAVAAARRQGEGFGPFRGLRRLEVRVFGADVAPPTQVYEPALRFELNRFSRAIDEPHREAAVRLRGLRPVVVPDVTGRALDRDLAASVVVRALAALHRTPVELPVRLDPARVTAADLRPVAARVRTAVSAPVRLALGPTRWRLPRWRIAQLLELPSGGRRTLRIGGAAATAYFARLERTVGHPPVDAGWAVDGETVSVTAARPGVAVDVPETARRLLAAAVTPTPRLAHLAVRTAPAQRSTAEARAMAITTRISSYETFYGGDPNRIHNVQLVAHLVDRQLVAPGATFSFNGATGERTANKGFRVAPVIINGELQTGLGGGVCQVSTTVFNAAYDAGLGITERTNHALYISHYPLGRDATVNYPDIDLKFVNDTDHWLLLRTFVGDSSLVVNLYGAPLHRRVVTETSPLVETAQPPLKRVPDPSLPVGETVLEDSGEPARSTSVHRRVYDGGRLIHDDVWSSSYRAEPKIVRVGTKPNPKPPPEPPRTTSTATTETTTTATSTTTPAPPGPPKRVKTLP